MERRSLPQYIEELAWQRHLAKKVYLRTKNKEVQTLFHILNYATIIEMVWLEEFTSGKKIRKTTPSYGRNLEKYIERVSKNQQKEFQKFQKTDNIVFLQRYRGTELGLLLLRIINGMKMAQEHRTRL